MCLPPSAAEDVKDIKFAAEVIPSNCIRKNL